MASKFRLELDVVVELNELLGSISEALEPHLAQIIEFTVRMESPGADSVLIVEAKNRDCLEQIVNDIYGGGLLDEEINDFIDEIDC